MTLPLHIYKHNFSERKIRHKALLSHYVVPKCLKSGTDAVPQKLCKKNIHQQPEKSKRKCPHPEYLFMFKPCKNSFYYLLVFSSLLAVFLATNHPRMGKGPLYPSPTSTKASTTSCCQRRPLVRRNSGLPRCLSQSAAALSNRSIWQLESPDLHFSRKCFPLNYCHPQQGLHWYGSGVSKVWLVFCTLLSGKTSTLTKPHFICHVRSHMHIVTEAIQIYSYPELCIVNLNSDEI